MHHFLTTTPLLPLFLSTLPTLALAHPGVAPPPPAIPKTSTSSTASSSQQTNPPSSHIPANGITCATANETAHILDANTISLVQSGASTRYQYYLTNQNTESDIADPAPSWPREFALSMVASSYTVIPAQGCQWEDGVLLYAPISYPGTIAPTELDGNGKPNAVGTITPDIVVFQTPVREQDADGVAQGAWLPGPFCAVLTNSDAGAGEQLFVQGGDGSVNEKVGGYHQCNAA
ncbi:uncharacterized protein KY384_000801 [Bacidia gigantensis]|uniref:uncharacterized protein n=1 Tax=Bacidia gigantensis TaxID=2732470 RepID=UPI001D03A2D9|nr:uncharacterized protein KY384_000801 [Bacidia gigantensis]KAG8526039.1 hypothetical protein KY384_000801 [Bacidia gigantensis]